MAVMEVFSTDVKLKYRSRTCSLSTLTVAIFILLTIVTPFVLISNTGGFWLKNRVFFEFPSVSFEYKYLLIAETGENVKPIVCSTFTVYKENPIEDDCIFFKVREIDVNNDGKNDFFQFETKFYTDKPIEIFRLLLFFDFQLKERFEANVKSIAVFDFPVTREIREISFSADLELIQKGLLHSSGLYESYNRSLDLSEFTLPELLAENAKKKFTAKIRNVETSVKSGFSPGKAFAISGKLRYAEIPLNYQPDFAEEMRNAWIQYFSLLAIFLYVSRQALRFLFARKILNSYVVLPWPEKCN